MCSEMKSCAWCCWDSFRRRSSGHEHVAVARHDDAIAPRREEFTVEFARDGEHDVLLRTRHPLRTRVDAAVAGIDHDRRYFSRGRRQGLRGSLVAVVAMLDARHAFDRGGDLALGQLHGRRRHEFDLQAVATARALPQQPCRLDLDRPRRLDHHPRLARRESPEPERPDKARAGAADSRRHRELDMAEIDDDAIWRREAEDLEFHGSGQVDREPGPCGIARHGSAVGGNRSGSRRGRWGRVDLF